MDPEEVRRFAKELKRFNDRENNPLKRWKLTPDDWRNREKRKGYEKALRYMVATTDSKHAPWDLIPAENKHYARAKILETLIDRWVHDLTRRGLDVPAPVHGSYLKGN